MKQIRAYQKRGIAAIINGVKNGIDKQLFVAATGSGKTFMAAKATKPICGDGRLLWITHTEELLEQSKNAIASEFETNDVGLIKADVFDIDHRIIMASAQTLWRRLDRLPSDYFDVIVADECHLFGAKTFNMSLDHFTPKLRLGLTATPFRLGDGMLMGDIFDEIIFEYNIDNGIADGFLCELDALRIKTNIDLDGVHTRAGELNQNELEEVINTPERNSLIVDKYVQYASGRQFLAFCVDVQHTRDLCTAFNDRGIATNFIVGDKHLTTDRSGIIQSFKQGQYAGLTNCNVLTAGFDHPNVGCIIAACPTKSLTKYLQQIGRGTRLKNEAFVKQFGQNCIILDFIDNTIKHRLVNTWTLDKAKPPQERTFTTQVKKLKLLEERERRIKASGLDRDTFVNLLSLPVPVFSNSIRMEEPATEDQLAWIKRLDYDVVNINYTKRMCMEIISNLPESPNNVYWLQQRGYDVSGGVTRAEYKLALREIKIREAKANAERLKKENKFPYEDIH